MNNKIYNTIALSLLGSVTIFSSLDIIADYARKKIIVKENIQVTGSSSIDFTSDLIVWKASFYAKDENLKSAFSKIKSDRKKINEFLSSKGLSNDQIVFKSINIKKEYKTKKTYNKDGDPVDSEELLVGYNLSQELIVSSSNVELVELISNEVTELIEQNIYISSYSPDYFYSKLGELKIKMIDLAAKDGLLRAQTAVEGSGAQLGGLIQTSIGVFQILGKNSNDKFSWGGTLNTKNKNKTAKVNVKQKFKIK